ncbi:uncharacterized protein BDZ99DRAFT_537666 [Mytilinidion resinicola]|uniref:Uncharacterized protein n=1 Tax=Mytilinidion resinicola TaxID=574789 RepID=A0A6A6YD98_9PEZI|nr:uncharacterized protein BDZ99DRAFT_537666 [Mytilinidion resinicola]KAF2806801.1 hypothetical protein BDZ99DRAFT_537666 [Mytilinidion resinicola]
MLESRPGRSQLPGSIAQRPAWTSKPSHLPLRHVGIARPVALARSPSSYRTGGVVSLPPAPSRSTALDQEGAGGSTLRSSAKHRASRTCTSITSISGRHLLPSSRRLDAGRTGWWAAGPAARARLGGVDKPPEQPRGSSVGALARAGSPHTRLPLNGRWCERPACLSGAEKQNLLAMDTVRLSERAATGSQASGRAPPLLPCCLACLRSPRSSPTQPGLLFIKPQRPRYRVSLHALTARGCHPSSYPVPFAMPSHPGAIIEPAPARQLHGLHRAMTCDRRDRPPSPRPDFWPNGLNTASLRAHASRRPCKLLDRASHSAVAAAKHGPDRRAHVFRGLAHCNTKPPSHRGHGARRPSCTRPPASLCPDDLPAALALHTKPMTRSPAPKMPPQPHRSRATAALQAPLCPPTHPGLTGRLHHARESTAAFPSRSTCHGSRKLALPGLHHRPQESTPPLRIAASRNPPAPRRRRTEGYGSHRLLASCA